MFGEFIHGLQSQTKINARAIPHVNAVTTVTEGSASMPVIRAEFFPNIDRYL
jgi:hypothetical protein